MGERGAVGEQVSAGAQVDEFVERVAALRGDLMRSLTSRGADVNDADDVVQDALLKAFGHLERRRTRVELRPWLMQVTRHVLYDRVRRQQVREAASGDADLDVFEGRQPEPAEVLEGAERRYGDRLVPSLVAERAVQAGLGSLRDRDRELLVDHYERGRGLAEIAAREGVHSQTVKVRLFRARRRLANQVERRLATATPAGSIR